MPGLVQSLYHQFDVRSSFSFSELVAQSHLYNKSALLFRAVLSYGQSRMFSKVMSAPVILWIGDDKQQFARLIAWFHTPKNYIIEVKASYLLSNNCE